jgi:predicted O-linked N-acetylglucosamine transferase (SPINDLY family)
MGLTELLARSSEEYVQLATGLAGDRDRLKGLRASLRDWMRKSPLMDAVGFTWEVEKIYREIWMRWINSAGSRTAQSPG